MDKNDLQPSLIIDSLKTLMTPSISESFRKYREYLFRSVQRPQESIRLSIESVNEAECLHILYWNIIVITLIQVLGGALFATAMFTYSWKAAAVGFAALGPKVVTVLVFAPIGTAVSFVLFHLLTKHLILSDSSLKQQLAAFTSITSSMLIPCAAIGLIMPVLFLFGLVTPLYLVTIVWAAVMVAGIFLLQWAWRDYLMGSADRTKKVIWVLYAFVGISLIFQFGSGMGWGSGNSYRTARLAGDAYLRNEMNKMAHEEMDSETDEDEDVKESKRIIVDNSDNPEEALKKLEEKVTHGKDLKGLLADRAKATVHCEMKMTANYKDYTAACIQAPSKSTNMQIGAIASMCNPKNPDVKYGDGPCPVKKSTSVCRMGSNRDAIVIDMYFYGEAGLGTNLQFCSQGGKKGEFYREITAD